METNRKNMMMSTMNSLDRVVSGWPSDEAFEFYSKMGDWSAFRASFYRHMLDAGVK